MSNEKKKIGKGQTLLILVVVLAVLIGVLFGIKAYNAKTEEKAADDTAQTEMMTINTDDIDTFSYNVDGAVYTFQLGEEGWIYPADTTLSLEQDSVDAMLTNVTSLKTDTIVSENLDNAGDYGLDSPQFTLTVKMTDGTEKSLYIGSENPMMSVYYAYIEGDNRIFTVSADVQTAFVSIDSLMATDDEDSSDDSAEADSSTGETDPLAETDSISE